MAIAQSPTLAPQGGAEPKAEGSLLGGMAKDMLLGTGRRQRLLETAAKQVVRTAASQAGRALLRGVMGSLLRR